MTTPVEPFKVPFTIPMLPDAQTLTGTREYLWLSQQGVSVKIHPATMIAQVAVPITRRIDTDGGLTGGGDLSANRTLSMTDTSVLPGAYTNANITVDQKGRITSASNGSSSGGTVTQIDTGTGLIGGPITSTGTISLDDTTVIPDAYGDASHVASFTVNAQGQLVAAAPIAIAIAAGAVSGLAPSATTNALDASNISTGTLPSGRLTGSYTGITDVGTLNSPTFTGTPTAPTAAVDTSTTQIATTAFVINQAGGSSPLALAAAAAVGTSARYSRQDHAHPLPGTPLITTYTSGSGTHTITGTPRYVRVRMVASGGSGSGSGTSPGNGTAGSNTTFGSWTTVGGGAAIGQTGGAGGTGGTNGTGTVVMRLAGTRGMDSRSGYTFCPGGMGGGTFFGQAVGNYASEASRTGPPNTGVGGSGGSADATGAAGAGGGGGEMVEFMITSVASSYSYAVGAGKSGGTAGTGTGTRAGSASQAGLIVVEEYYV